MDLERKRGRPCGPPLRGVAERNALAMTAYHLVRHVVRRLLHDYPAVRRLGEGEAESVGYVTLLRAAEIYDERRGVRFCTYAYRSIRRQVLRASIEGNHGAIRIPGHCFLQGGVSERAVANARRALQCRSLDEERAPPAPGPGEYEVDELEGLHAAMQRLPEQQRQALRLRYWDGLLLTEVGAALGVSKQRVQQILNKALAALRQELPGPVQ